MTRVTENRSICKRTQRISSHFLPLFFSLSLLTLYSGISKFPQERTLCEIWVRELSSKPTSSTVIVVVVVVEKIKSARLRRLQAVWGRPTRADDDRGSHIATRILSRSSFPKKKHGKRIHADRLIVCCSYLTSIAFVHRFLPLNSKSTSSLVHRLHDRGINFSTRYTFIRTISRNTYIFTAKINFADKRTFSFLRHLSRKLKSWAGEETAMEFREYHSLFLTQLKYI